GLLDHLLDVGTRSKGLVTRTGQNRAALAGIGLKIGKGGSEFLQYRAVKRIECLGPVEREKRDGALLFDKDRIVAHRGFHSSWGGKGAKIESISSSLTSSGVAGFHLGVLSLSTMTARTPSAKSGRTRVRL